MNAYLSMNDVLIVFLSPYSNQLCIAHYMAAI